MENKGVSPGSKHSVSQPSPIPRETHHHVLFPKNRKALNSFGAGAVCTLLEQGMANRWGPRDGGWSLRGPGPVSSFRSWNLGFLLHSFFFFSLLNFYMIHIMSIYIFKLGINTDTGDWMRHGLQSYGRRRLRRKQKIVVEKDPSEHHGNPWQRSRGAVLHRLKNCLELHGEITEIC